MSTRKAHFLPFSLLGILVLMANAAFLIQTTSLAQTQPVSKTQATMPPVKLDESKGCIVPFSYDPPTHPFIIVQVRINKSKPMPFIVDTGAQALIFLFPWAAEELHLQTDKATPQRPGSNIASQRITTNCSINIMTLPGPAIDFNTDTAYVTDFPHFENAATPHIAGIVGIGIFRLTTARFDFDKKTVTFFVDKHPPLNLPPPAATLAMPPDPEWLRANVAFSATQTLPFLIDTGSNMTLLPAKEGKDTEKLPRLAEGATTMDNASGHHVFDNILISSLLLGNQKTPLVSMMLDSQAILGLDVLTRFRVTLDTRNGFLTLEPRTNFVSKLQGAADLELSFRDGKTYIDKILRPLQNAKFAVGDRLLSIDGKEVGSQTYIETYLQLNGYAGTRATLVVEKEREAKVTVPWLRHSQFPDLVTGAWGLTLVTGRDHTLQIVYVAPGSEAAHKNLKAGYEVVAVNGASLNNVTWDSLQELFAIDAQGGTLIKTMQIVHNHGEQPVTVSFIPSKP